MITLGANEIPLSMRLVSSGIQKVIQSVWVRRNTICLILIALFPGVALNWIAQYIQTSSDVPNVPFLKGDVAEALLSISSAILILQVFALAMLFMFSVGRKGAGTR